MVRTSVTHSAIASCATFLFLPHFGVICGLLITEQTHGNMESICLNRKEKYKKGNEADLKLETEILQVRKVYIVIFRSISV